MNKKFISIWLNIFKLLLVFSLHNIRLHQFFASWSILVNPDVINLESWAFSPCWEPLVLCLVECVWSMWIIIFPRFLALPIWEVGISSADCDVHDDVHFLIERSALFCFILPWVAHVWREVTFLPHAIIKSHVENCFTVECCFYSSFGPFESIVVEVVTKGWSVFVLSCCHFIPVELVVWSPVESRTKGFVTSCCTSTAVASWFH